MDDYPALLMASLGVIPKCFLKLSRKFFSSFNPIKSGISFTAYFPLANNSHAFSIRIRWIKNLGASKGGKTKRVNMWSVWKWMIALVFKVLGWSRGEWAAKTKRLHRFTLGLHLSLVWTPFKWNALHWRWDRGDFGVLSSIALHGLLFPHIQR